MGDGKVINFNQERRRRGPRFDRGPMEALELSRDLVCLCRSGVITAINEAGASLLGSADPEQLRGRKLAEFLVPEYHQVLDMFLSGKGSEDKPVPTRIIALDQTVKIVELRIHRARELAPDATMVVGRDISGLMGLGLKIRFGGSFGIPADNTMNLVCHAVQGMIREINRAGLALLRVPDLAALAGMPLSALFSPDYGAIVTPDMLSLLIGESPLPMKLQARDGSAADVLAAFSRVPDGGVMVEARDISAETRAARKLDRLLVRRSR
jgi:PAS domain-containing protein